MGAYRRVGNRYARLRLTVFRNDLDIEIFCFVAIAWDRYHLSAVNRNITQSYRAFIYLERSSLIAIRQPRIVKSSLLADVADGYYYVFLPYPSVRLVFGILMLNADNGNSSIKIKSGDKYIGIGSEAIGNACIILDAITVYELNVGNRVNLIIALIIRLEIEGVGSRAANVIELYSIAVTGVAASLSVYLTHKIGPVALDLNGLVISDSHAELFSFCHGIKIVVNGVGAVGIILDPRRGDVLKSEVERSSRKLS